MKKFIITFIAIIACISLFGQKWTLSYTLPTGTTVSDIEPIGTQVIAATSVGLYRTNNAGTSWAQVSTFVAKDISCYDKAHCFACGNNGVVMKTSDSGLNWSVVATQPHASKTINLIKAVSANEVIVAIGGVLNNTFTHFNNYYTDTLLVTNNGGNSWRKYPIPTSWGAQTPYTYIYDSTQIFNTRNDWNLYRTGDLGKTNTQSMLAQYIRQIDMIDKNIGYAVLWYPNGQDVPTNIYKTTDGGKTFQLHFHSKGTNLFVDNISDDPGSIDFIDENTGWMSGLFRGGFDIYKSIDGGKTWSTDTFGLGNISSISGGGRHFRLKMVSSNYGWVFINGVNKILKYGEYTCAGFTAKYTHSAQSGNSIKFTNTSSGNANKFSWKFGDGNTSTAQNPTHTYSGAGTYSVCFIVRDTVNGCLDSTCKNITLNNACAGFVANYAASAQAGTSVKFTNISSANANKFTWKFGDGNTSTATHPTHTYSAAGTYTVCLIARDTVANCLDSTCKSIVVGPNGLAEAPQLNISVYPNPSQNGLFNLQYNESSPIAQMRVMDINGREINQAGISTINLTAEKPGVYFLVIETESGTISYIKLLKQ